MIRARARARARAVVSKCLRRPRRCAAMNFNNHHGIWRDSDGLVNHLRSSSCFFCTSNSISQVERPTLIKSPVADLPRLGEECSSESEDECSSESGEECSLTDEWSPRLENMNDLVTPLVQVFSVTLHTDFDDDRPCQIYGSVNAINAQGAISNLYNRPLSNPHIIPNGGMFSLLGAQESHEDFITYGTTSNTTIDFDLKDTSRNTVVIKDKYNLHSVTDDIQDSSNKFIKDVVHGEHGFALLYYTKFLYADNVVVKLAIFSKRHTHDPFLDVYGNIVAGYGNARQYCNNDDEMRHMKSTLFSKPFDHPERVRVGRTMRLSRYLVAVPAKSSLVIDVDISDSHGQLVGGSVEFQCPGISKKLIDDEFGTVVVTVGLGGNLGFFSEVDINDEDAEETEVHALATDSLVGVSNITAYQEKNLVYPDQPRNLTFNPSRSTRSYSSMRWTSENINVVKEIRMHGCALVEVFSAYVVGNNHEISAISGKISVHDHERPEWSMYDRGLDNPEVFPPHRKGIVTLDGHYAISNNYSYDIHVYLKDPINNKEVCNSSIGHTWVSRNLLYDERVCSFIRGVHGHVVIHHIIFESACQANLEISFSPDYPSSLPVNVCGSVIASYSNHNYSTDYEKKFYRSQLFYKPETELVQLDCNSRVPLSKSAVAVPEGAALVVEVDLQAVSSSSNSKEIVFGKKELKIQMSKTVCEEILCKYYRVQISATFKDV